MGIGDDFDAVLGAAQVGAEWAFTILYRDFNPRLLRYFSAQAPRAAEDLASETWLGAARQMGGFRGSEAAFGAWLFTIAHSRLVQHWRDTNRGNALLLAPDVLVDYPSSQDLENQVVDAATAQQAARQIAALLSPDQAQIVLLRVLGGLDVDQVARILNKRPGTVRVLQHRALRRLAKKDFSLETVTP
jgi:RNA polymerase sigma-70 factor (ECF subfamily)